MDLPPALNRALTRCVDCSCLIMAANPVTVRLIGLCPLLALSNTVTNASVVTLLFYLIVLSAGLVTALLRHLVSWRLKPLYHALLAATIVSSVVTTASIVSFRAIDGLGIYASLIAGNCFLLSFIQEVGERADPFEVLSRGLRELTALAIFLILFALVREFLAYGAISIDSSWNRAPATGPLPIFAGAPGALLLLALVLAASNGLRARQSQANRQRTSVASEK